MPKLKAPLFGLQAHGSLNRELTYTSRRQFHVAKTIPQHFDSRTSSQLTQRFLYRLGIALWNGLDAAGRAVYTAQATGRSLTAMNVFLREWLTTLPNLTYCIPLQEGSGLIAYDRSPSNWPSTITGCSWLPLDSGYQLSSDGLNDFVALPNATALSLDTTTLSFIFAMTGRNIGNGLPILDKRPAAGAGWMLWRTSIDSLVLTTYNAAGNSSLGTTAPAYVQDTRAVWGLSAAAGSGSWYKDGADVTGAAPAHRIPDPNATIAKFFVRTYAPPLYAAVDLEWFAIFDRALTPAEHLAIATAFTPRP